ncbi:MAG: hypothetical protein IKB61_02470, partial [Elusimicrobiaceae bacterium]|nr:hypothetical protein [Elusimicrobiaceae bacterium]
VENILAPKNADTVVDAVEREADRGLLLDEIIHSISNHELFISRVVNAGPAPMNLKEAFDMAGASFSK